MVDTRNAMVCRGNTFSQRVNHQLHSSRRGGGTGPRVRPAAAARRTRSRPAQLLSRAKPILPFLLFSLTYGCLTAPHLPLPAPTAAIHPRDGTARCLPSCDLALRLLRQRLSLSHPLSRISRSLPCIDGHAATTSRAGAATNTSCFTHRFSPPHAPSHASFSPLSRGLRRLVLFRSSSELVFCLYSGGKDGVDTDYGLQSRRTGCGAQSLPAAGGKRGLGERGSAESGEVPLREPGLGNGICTRDWRE